MTLRELQRSPAASPRRFLAEVALAHSAFACTALACSNQKDATYLQQVSDGARPAAPAPSGLAGQTPIVFRSDRGQAGVGDLYVMAQDGSHVTPLTQGGDYYFPKWSPSGQSVAFRRRVSAGQMPAAEGEAGDAPMPDGDAAAEEQVELGIIGVDGSPPAVLTRGAAAEYPLVPPHWSKDGRQLSFGSMREQEQHVWVVPRAGGEVRRLLPDLGLQEDAATWSWANPSLLAFTGLRDAGQEVWMVDLGAASEPVNLTQGRVFAPAFPRWSPDGNRIAFNAFALDADGALEGLGGRPGEDFSVPDEEIFVIDVRSLELTRVTDNSAEDQVPVWAPGGQSLLISSDRDGDFDPWLVPLADPSQAVDLIDDADDPHQEDMADWYWAPP